MSGLLADLYSAGDRMKRKLGGLLSNPLETVALGSTRMAEDVNALTRLASEAGYMPNTVNRADQSVLVSERQKALARALLADKGAEMGSSMVGMLYHGGELVPNPTAFKQAVMTRGVPGVSSSPNMLEAARYAIHNNGPINAIDDSAMRIYQQGMSKKLDAAYKANNFDAIRDAGFDGVKLFHSNEHVLFDPERTLQASKKVAEVFGGYDSNGVLKNFQRLVDK